MKLKRRFYDSSINLNRLSLKRLVLGVVIGLVSAFIIYSFFYVVQESFRVISFELTNYGFQNSQSIISERDRKFYKLFFAGLALVIGNSITILYLFSKPGIIINRLNPKRKRILNDQIFLSFNFAYWFNKIGLAFGVFSMCCMDFEYITYFKPLAYLLLIVLYLESWKNLSLVLKKNRFKIQLLHLLTISILAIGLSRVDIVDYKMLDELSLKYNPIVDLPDSIFYNDPDHWNNFEISFKLKVDERNNFEVFTEDKTKIDLYEVADYILKESRCRREEMLHFLKVRIMADKNINIKYVKMFEAELYAINKHNIIYEVYNEDLFKSKLENGSINKRINKSVLKFRLNTNNNYEVPLVPRIREDIRKGVNIDTLKIIIGNQINVNGLFTSNTDLIEKFKKHVKKETLFLYSYCGDAKYQDYITVLSSHYKAVYTLRENEQTIFRKSKYDKTENYLNEQSELKLKFPIQLIENLNPGSN